MGSNRAVWMVGGVVALLAGPAFAHRPTFGDPHPSPQTAFVVTDPAISIVVYQTISCDGEQLWLRLDGKAGQEVYLQLGVPQIERLAGARPAIALFAPGFPAVDLPFAAPMNLGGQVWYGADLEEPATFYEPFTQTSSWVWAEQRVTLPEDGVAYIAAWNPDRITGKLWVAVGEVEDFAGVGVEEFVSWDKDVNNFHETGEYEEPPTAPERSCVVEEAPEPSGGCDTSGGARAWGALALLAAARRRR